MPEMAEMTFPRDRALARHLLDEVLVQPVDVEGVLPDEERLHALDDGGVAAAPVGLAGADDARVSVDADEDPRVVAVDHRRLYVRNLGVTDTAPRIRDVHRLRREVPHGVLRVRVAELVVIDHWRLYIPEPDTKACG
jgi:hypothetical protein